MNATPLILIVDDHAVMREGLHALIDMKLPGAVVSEAAGGKAALEMAAREMPDVILMDISMPELNGIETLRLLRSRHPAIRAIMLSMHSNAEDVHRALEAGACGYIFKEDAGREIITALKQVLAGGNYVSPAATAVARQSRNQISPLSSLSERERLVLQRVVEGHSSADIAAALHLSPKTVETYRSRLMQKLGVKSLPELVKFALRHGITGPA